MVPDQAHKTVRLRTPILVIAAAISLVAAAAVVYFAAPLPSLDRSRDASALVLAADGSILRGFLSRDAKWRLPVEPDRVSSLYRRMLIAAEDQRFAVHPGVDPIAMLRAGAQFAISGHIVSGA